VEAARGKSQRRFGGVMLAVAIQSCQSAANGPNDGLGRELIKIK
jgi:hypothetical protein